MQHTRGFCSRGMASAWADQNNTLTKAISWLALGFLKSTLALVTQPTVKEELQLPPCCLVLVVHLWLGVVCGGKGLGVCLVGDVVCCSSGL